MRSHSDSLCTGKLPGSRAAARVAAPPCAHHRVDMCVAKKRRPESLQRHRDMRDIGARHRPGRSAPNLIPRRRGSRVGIGRRHGPAAQTFYHLHFFLHAQARVTVGGSVCRASSCFVGRCIFFKAERRPRRSIWESAIDKAPSKDPRRWRRTFSRGAVHFTSGMSKQTDAEETGSRRARRRRDCPGAVRRQGHGGRARATTGALGDLEALREGGDLRAGARRRGC